MQTRRYAPAAAALNGKLYVLGGYVSEGGYPYQILPTVEAYDPTTDTWTNKASMTRARFAHGAVTLNGTIYAIGGNSTADGAALASVEQYDPVSDTWTNKADLPTPRVSFAAAVVNGNIYVVGGVIGNTAVAGVYIYNSTSDTWSIGANIPTPRATLAAVVVNGQILAMGGSIPGAGGTSRVEQYDPAYNVWSSELDMPTSSRNECYAAVIGNTVYVFGGYDNYTMQSVGVQPVLKIFTAIELEFFTETNKVYVLQASPDLVTWTNFDVFLGNGDFWRKLYSTRGQSRLFYRVVPSQ